MFALAKGLLILALALAVSPDICAAQEVQDGALTDESLHFQDPITVWSFSDLLDNQLSECEIDNKESLADDILSLSLKKTWSEERKGIFGTVYWDRENGVRLYLVKIGDKPEKYRIVLLEESSKSKAPAGQWRVAGMDSAVIKDTVKIGHVVTGPLAAGTF